MSERLPIDTEKFWMERLHKAYAQKEPHRAIWDVPYERWAYTNARHKVLLHSLLKPIGRPLKVLDVGCGLGVLSELVPEHVQYTGMDQIMCLIQKARDIYPDSVFTTTPLNKLAYGMDGREFQRFTWYDIAICRGLHDSVTTNLGAEVWRIIEDQILQIADRVILLNYGDPHTANVYDSPRIKTNANERSLQVVGGRLDYRLGQDATVEIYDIEVEEGSRRKGVGRRLVHELIEIEGCHSVFAFTRITNTTAQAFYRGLGFTETILPQFYRGMDGVMYTLVLDRGIVPQQRS